MWSLDSSPHFYDHYINSVISTAKFGQKVILESMTTTSLIIHYNNVNKLCGLYVGL